MRILVTATLLLAFSTASTSLAKSSEIYLDPNENAANYLSCLAQQKVTLISAHRGGPTSGFPENALESLKNALSHGPMLLEVDVRQTRDGELVLLHDESLERTTTGTGNLSDYTLDELKVFRLLDNQQNVTQFSIPTLKETLEWADEKTILQIDVKRGIDYEKVARAVVAAEAVDSVLIIAYRAEDIAISLEVDEQLSFSYSINHPDDLTALEKLGVSEQQIIAWTGVVDETSKPVWPTLESLGIPFAAGAFWDLEERIVATDNTQPYIDISAAGTDIIGSDYYWLAYDTLASQQDLAAAITLCERQ